jgi:hypothetical protein
VTPGGSSFAMPEKLSMSKLRPNLDESVLLSGSFKRNLSKFSDSEDIENRIQIAVMERVKIDVIATVYQPLFQVQILISSLSKIDFPAESKTQMQMLLVCKNLLLQSFT